MNTSLNLEQEFHYKLIKGKIAEQVFELMFRAAHEFTVIPFGYESVLPTVAEFSSQGARAAVLDTIRCAPDFALIDRRLREVYLVEVKYRSHIDMDDIVRHASAIQDMWAHACIFVATPGGFYFDTCLNVIEKRYISQLRHDWIRPELQETYLEFLKEFIPPTYKK